MNNWRRLTKHSGVFCVNDAQRIKAVYNFEKVDHLPRREFYIWEETKERWKAEGWDGDISAFKFDASTGLVGLPVNLGWVDAPVVPPFNEEVVEVTDKYEYVRFSTGEIRMYPIGKRHGVMPMFSRAPVESKKDWEKVIKTRLDPDTPERWTGFEEKMKKIKDVVSRGERLLDAGIIGGYMYLRSLMGPENVLYVFYDDPDLVHDMMQTWLKLMVTCLTKVQDHVQFFKLFLAEDISFKTGPLISPQMVEEFLMPYYRELIQTLRTRQKEFLHVEIDTDGNPDVLLPIYIKNGFTAWSPCEVAAGCDPVEMAKKYPNLVICGGIDKRILAEGKDAIRREIDRIVPFMRERGGYIPTCDHGVPDDVSFENYLFYREYITSIDF